MDFLKKMFFSVLIAASIASMPSVSSAAGKIENATTADVKEAIDNTIKSIEEAVANLNNGGDKDEVMALILKAAQSSKRIESNSLDVKRSRATSALKKARLAVKNDKKELALGSLTDALKGFQEIKSLY